VVKYTKGDKMQLSNQALGAIMLALQESLLEQTDIVPILKGFKLQDSESGEGLVITNPPTVKFTDDTEVTREDLEKLADR
jgi:hypothetical protein|tara:strand:+ start:17 stop:256 length:240 start_codon:yes stop_codon:yes gene_type:complete